MTMAIPFNSLEYAHKLEKAGMSKELAEVQAQTQFEIIQALADDHAVTKKDVEDIRGDIENIRVDIKDIRQDISGLKNDLEETEKGLRGHIDQTEKGLKRDIDEVKKDLTIRLGLMMSSGLFVLIALMKLLHL